MAHQQGRQEQHLRTERTKSKASKRINKSVEGQMDCDQMPMSELQAKAREMGMKNYSRLKRDELIKAIQRKSH